MQRFLCWDNFHIEKSENLTVFQHKPEKKNLALVCDGLWEGVHNSYASFMEVNGKYRVYYRAWGQPGFVFPRGNGLPDKSFICVAESDDGITFTKPILGKFEYGGSKENNIVFYRDNGRNLDTFSVYYDKNPNCPADEKFKALARDQATDILDYYASADGYDFRFIERVDVKGTFDSQNVVFWCEEEQQYRMYFRGFHHRDGSDAADIHDVDETNDIRDVRLAISKDFRNWEFIDYIKFEEGQEYIQLYTNQIVNYFRNPGTFIGFPMRYCDRSRDKENFKYMPLYEKRKSIIEKYGRGGTAVTDTAIMTSHDGLHFNRREKAFVSPGPECNTNWWYGSAATMHGLIETPSDTEGAPNEISLYLKENYRVKNVNFRRYTVRLDGFFSWFSDGKGGEVVTKPFVLRNDKMFVNFATSVSGGLNITILDESENELEGYNSYTLFGDSVNRPVEFEKSLKDLIGKTIKIKFSLNDCHLYSFTFE